MRRLREMLRLSSEDGRTGRPVSAMVPVEAVWSADAQGKAALVMKTRADALKTTVLVGDAAILDDRTKPMTRWLDRLQGRADPDDVLMDYTVERSQFLTSDPAH